MISVGYLLPSSAVVTFGSTLRVCATNVRSAVGERIAARMSRCSAAARSLRPGRSATGSTSLPVKVTLASRGFLSTTRRTRSISRTTAWSL